MGERFEVLVERVAHGGHCVARHEGRVVFVRHALPGERVLVEVTSGTDRQSFVRADAISVLEASPDRRDAPCPVSGPGGCGGCDWQHTTAAHGRELKAAVVREQLTRLAGLDLPVQVEPVPGDQDGLRWRTRVDFAVDAAGRAGLHPYRSREVIALEDCLIATEVVIDSGALQRTWPAGSALTVAASSAGELALTLRPGAQVPETIHEVVDPGSGPLRLAVAADGFWQVHPGAAGTFVGTVLDFLQPRPGECAVDLYAGVGLFAAALAPVVGQTGAVHVVEGEQTAAEHAQANLAGYPWAQVHPDEVAHWVAAGTVAADLVVLDPPRSGAGAQVMQAVLAGRPRAVAYVACDPAALARDLRTALDQGYRVAQFRAFDSFPMTHHVECIALLEPLSAAPG